MKNRSGPRKSGSSGSQGTLLSDFAGRAIVPKVKKPTSSESYREKHRILRRSKDSERKFAKWLVEHDGPDPRLHGTLTTSTGRVGHITNIRADCLSRSFLGENKNVILPATLGKWWQLICEKAIEWHKDPVLHWEPPNKDKFPVAGRPLPDLYILNESRYARLLECERKAIEAGLVERA
jgi:hypothetical protein